VPGKVAVIGSGIAGLAVAARLAARGFEVSVFEKNATPGGKISEIRHEGFRFDTGPSLFTLPGSIHALFTLAGENPEDHFIEAKLPLVCRYFYNDGMIINAWADPAIFSGQYSLFTSLNHSEVSTRLTRNISNIKTPSRFLTGLPHIMDQAHLKPLPR
jgi:phytoene dehydrogenase-like protein